MNEDLSDVIGRVLSLIAQTSLSPVCGPSCPSLPTILWWCGDIAYLVECDALGPVLMLNTWPRWSSRYATLHIDALGEPVCIKIGKSIIYRFEPATFALPYLTLLYLTGKACYRLALRLPVGPVRIPELTFRLLKPLGVFSKLQEWAPMFLS